MSVTCSFTFINDSQYFLFTFKNVFMSFVDLSRKKKKKSLSIFERTSFVTNLTFYWVWKVSLSFLLKTDSLLIHPFGLPLFLVTRDLLDSTSVIVPSHLPLVFDPPLVSDLTRQGTPDSIPEGETDFPFPSVSSPNSSPHYTGLDVRPLWWPTPYPIRRLSSVSSKPSWAILW